MKLKFILTHRFVAEVDGSTPCARCHGRTLLAPITPAGPTGQFDVMVVYRDGKPGDPIRIDVEEHDCARWEGEAKAGMLATLRLLTAVHLARGLSPERAKSRAAVAAVLDDAERRERAGGGGGPCP